MDESKIIDLAARLEQRTTGQANDALQLAREHFIEAFRILSEQHGLSDEWAAEKATIANEIVEEVCGPYDYKLSIAIPVQLDEQHDAAIRAALEKWAHEFHRGAVKRCLEAFGGRLLELALPKAR